jgi:hypothetical protein
MPTPTPTWAWAIPLIVAILALCGVTFTIVIQWRNFNRELRSAHALKISEMRQAWINNLRDAMSLFQSYGVTPNMNQNDIREWYEAGTRIELLMNPADPDYDELHERMDAFLGAKDPIEKFGANPAYVAVCQKILKREWEALKAEIRAAGGERT